MGILCNTLSPNDKAHAIPAEIGKTFEPITLTDKVIEVDVVPIITIASPDSIIEFYNFCISILIYGFCL